MLFIEAVSPPDTFFGGGIDRGNIGYGVDGGGGGGGETFLTPTATLLPGMEHEDDGQHGTTAVDSLDDVFGSAPASPTDDDDYDASAGVVVDQPTATTTGPHTRQPTMAREDVVSDVPRLRSMHVTNGYREGIAASKDKVLQEGFDQGFVVGAALGVRAGWCLGAIEGMAKATAARTATSTTGIGWVQHLQRRGMDGVAVSHARLVELLGLATAELDPRSLFCQDFFAPDGTPLYVSSGGDGEKAFVPAMSVTSDATHPLIVKWMETVRETSEALGLPLR